MVKTRSSIRSAAVAEESTPVERMQGTTGTEMDQAQAQVKGQAQVKDQLQIPTTNIMDLISSDIAALSQEGKVIVSTIVKAVSILSQEKDNEIAKLHDKVSSLQKTVNKLEEQLDDVEQYERRDTLIISGPALPCEQNLENPASLVVTTIKEHLHINLNQADINIAHRLGPKRQNKDRPLIVKLLNRSKKSEIMDACVTVKPSLYVNESLTPKRRIIFNTIWAIRKKNREIFQQCYTRDGKIFVKLKTSHQKHMITTEESLNTFLDKYPVLTQS